MRTCPIAMHEWETCAILAGTCKPGSQDLQSTVGDDVCIAVQASGASAIQHAVLASRIEQWTAGAMAQA